MTSITQLSCGVWDSHVHVIDELHFPFHPDYPYRPKQADLDALLQFASSHNVENLCLVAVSVYKNDNSSILSALARLKGKARAVVDIDPQSISDEELDILHQAGARGVRLNVKTWGRKYTKEQFAARLWAYADKIRRLGWVIQLYVSLDQIVMIYEVVHQLQVRVVIDHMASPSPTVPAKQQEGYKELVDLLSRGLIWVKISGTYRFPRLPDLDEYGRTLIATNSRRVVWASDWPHTGGTSQNPGGDRHKHQDFRLVDDEEFIKRCCGWCNNDSKLISRLFADNPQELWTSSD